MKAEEFFTSPHQLKRYYHAIELAKIFKQYQDQGYTFIWNNEIVNGKIDWNTEFTNSSGRFDMTWEIVSLIDDGCKFVLVESANSSLLSLTML